MKLIDICRFIFPECNFRLKHPGSCGGGLVCVTRPYKVLFGGTVIGFRLNVSAAHSEA